MKNQIFIKELDTTNTIESSIINNFKRYKTIEAQIKFLEQQSQECLEHLINSGYDTIGIEPLNKRIAIVVKQPTKTIDYGATLKNITDIVQYQTIKVVEKNEYNDEKIINDLGDKVVYTLKENKPFLKISDLIKDKEIGE